MANPLTRKQVAEAIDALIHQEEHEGAEGNIQLDPLSDPLVFGAFRLLRHMTYTHADGMTGWLRVMRDIESKLYRLDED